MKWWDYHYHDYKTLSGIVFAAVVEFAAGAGGVCVCVCVKGGGRG